MHVCIHAGIFVYDRKSYGAFKKKGHLIFFSKASKQSAHTEDVTEETIYIWQCAGSSCSGTGYYDSIAERLSEPAQTALSRAVSHWGRDNNALMKYDTLPLHRSPTTSLSRTLHLTPTVGVGELQCCPVRWYTGWIHVCVCVCTGFPLLLDTNTMISSW